MTPAQTEPYLKHILATLELAHASNAQRYACTVPDPQQARGEAILHAHTQERILKSIAHTRTPLDAQAQTDAHPALTNLLEAAEMMIFSFETLREQEGYEEALAHFVARKRNLSKALAYYRQEK